MCRDTPAISYLPYANDFLISCWANKENAQVMVNCLELYCSWSGQAINTEKSSVFFLL